ncbi:MAG: AAA family ATPase [Paenisporosarcina sp.]
MQIQKLVIYGFGQHEDITIELKNGINVFFGWNEAGKTTIQQFMLSVLFGFPLRNQGLLRYEPKGGGRHGGQVHIKHPEFGSVIVERVKGKSAGDVTVFFEDGTRGEEEALKKVLYRYDRTSFESIFSFSIHQLQNFDKMTEEELSRTLLASGTTGVDAITKLEQRATKEMNTLFKKTGKNPEMNVKIEEIRDLEQTLKEARVKIDQYEPSILRISDIDQHLEILKEEEQKLKRQNEQYTKYRQAKPLLEQQLQFENQLSEIKQQSFPAEGIRRYEALKDRVQEMDIQMDQFKQSISQVEKQLNETFSSERIKEMEDLLSRESEWYHWHLRNQQLTNELEQSKRELEQHARLLGIKDEAHFKQVKEMDVSLQKEENFQQVIQSLLETEELIRFEKQSHERAKSEIEEAERKIEHHLKSEPSEADQQQTKKLQHLIRQLAELKVRQQVEHVPANKKSNTSRLVSIIIFVVSVIGAYFLGNWGIAVAGIFLSALIFVLLKQNHTVSDFKAKDYTADIATLEIELSKTEQLTEQAKLYKDRFTQLSELREEKKHVLTKLQENIRVATGKREEANEILNEYLFLHGFDGLMQPQLFPELFKRIRQIQELDQLILRKTTECEGVHQQIQARLTIIEQTTNESLSEDRAYSRLREVSNAMKDRQKEQVNIQDKMNEWTLQLNEKKKLHEVHSNDIQKLWNEAQVETEVAFYEADTAYRLKQSLQHDLQAIQVQLDSIGEVSFPVEDEVEQSIQLDQLDEQSQLILKTRNDLLEEKALLKQQTNSLLSDEHYGQTLQQFEQMKAELSELAHKWSVNKAVTEAIRQTMHNLKEKRLPFVLEKAQQFFTHLTNGRYDSLEVNENGIFEVVNPKGIRFGIAELSQATKEQAYISLRFALAESLIDTVPLPLIMDDPFVHFDRFRVQQMVQLMTELETSHQFMYFTCHEEMTTIWPQSHVINVIELQKERSVPSI